MTRQEAIMVVGRIGARYPAWNITDATMKEWSAELTEFPTVEWAWPIIHRTLQSHEGEWPPSISKIRGDLCRQRLAERPKTALPAPPDDMIEPEQVHNLVAGVIAKIDGIG